MTQQQTQTNQANKISNYLTFIVLIVMILALAAIFIAFETFLVGDLVTAGILAVIGAIAMALSLFLLFQSRRQNAAAVKIEIPKVMTTIGCTNSSCSNKIVREFQRGDFVFKELPEACPKCGGHQMITAIFKEVKEKEKTYAV
jgi:hypothetical protein